MHADELPVRANVAALCAIDQVVLGEWPTHHHPNYTAGPEAVPIPLAFSASSHRSGSTLRRESSKESRDDQVQVPHCPDGGGVDRRMWLEQ
jgi:hypothetical protein